MPRLIVIGGAPGSGKSTLASYLHVLLKAPWIDFGRLREFHLKTDWSDQSPAEEAMTFENLIQIIRNYFRHGYDTVIVDDLQDHRVQEMPSVFSDVQVTALMLTVHPQELRRRIISRNKGWLNVEAALEWNQRVIERPPAEHEYKIDVTLTTLEQVVNAALAILKPTQSQPPVG